MSELFLSHSSKDKKLATALARLLSAALYGSKKVEISDQIFFSSAPESGLIAGDQFDQIIEELKAAKRVVALVTPASARSVAVLAEMAIALNAKKLMPVAARKGHEKLLSWPFGETHAAELDSASTVKTCITALGGKLDRTVDAEGLEKECAELVHEARKSYVAPRTRLRIQRAAMALAGLLVLGMGAWAAVQYGSERERIRIVASLPKEYKLAVKQPQRVSGKRVIVNAAFTLPRRRLSERLYKIHNELGGGDAAKTHLLVEKVIRKGNTNAFWSLRNGAPERMISLAQKWQLEDVRYGDSETKGCDGLQPPDLNWCQNIFSLDTKQSEVSKRIDDTRFAVVEVEGEGELRVLTTRELTEVGGTKFEVTTIHNRERGEKPDAPEFVILLEQRGEDAREKN